jgi:hypothetical protein
VVLDGTFGGRGSRYLPTGTVDHGPEWVSTLGCLRLGSSFVCPDPDFPFLLSKRSHGLTDLAPRKVLKTASASVAGVAPGLADQLTFSQDAPQRGAQAAQVAVERAPEADSSVEAAVALGEAAGAAVASGPPDMALAPAAAEAVAVPAMERPVAADAEMAEASLLDVSEEGGVEPRPVPPSGSLVPARRSSDGRRQLLRFRTREASDPFFVLDDEREEQSWDELRECAEATVGSLRSSLEVFCRDVPKILQVMISGIPFFVIKASFVTPRFLPSGSDRSERRQVIIHPPRGRCLGFTAIPEDLACQGYRAPLPAGRRGGGPSVALCRSGSEGSSGML